MKNLSIFEPQIEKHYAYKKKHVGTVKLDSVTKKTQTVHPLFPLEIFAALYGLEMQCSYAKWYLIVLFSTFWTF